MSNASGILYFVAFHTIFLLAFLGTVVFTWKKVSQLRSTAAAYNTRLPFAYYSLISWIFWIVQYLVLVAGVLSFSLGSTVPNAALWTKTILWIGVMERALWTIAISFLYSQSKRFSQLAPPSLIGFSILMAFVSYERAILASNAFTQIDAVLCATIFTAFALSINELRFGKVFASAFFIHGLTQWLWLGLLFRASPENRLGILLVFPIWRMVLLTSWMKLTPKFLQIAQPLTVFLSYRRGPVGNAFAGRLKQSLAHHGYDVFLDVDHVGPGKWAEQILTQVMTRSHFILAITPGALDRCANANDWVRLEFERAVSSGRNIVPVLESSVNLDELRKSCPEEVQNLFEYDMPSVRHSAFERDVETLVVRYIPSNRAPLPHDVEAVSLITPFRVMISSAAVDLMEAKDAADNAIRDLHLDKFRFRTEMSWSTPDTTRRMSSLMAKQCDLLILIVGERYEHDGEEGLSTVEFEHNVAHEQNPHKILVYVKKVAHREQRQQEFLERMERLETRQIRFVTRNELPNLIYADVQRWLISRANVLEIKDWMFFQMGRLIAIVLKTFRR